MSSSRSTKQGLIEYFLQAWMFSFCDVNYTLQIYLQLLNVVSNGKEVWTSRYYSLLSFRYGTSAGYNCIWNIRGFSFTSGFIRVMRDSPEKPGTTRDYPVNTRWEETRGHENYVQDKVSELKRIDLNFWKFGAAHEIANEYRGIKKAHGALINFLSQINSVNI